ncbi:MAG: MBOAT family O-acyltransferase [Bacteroidota bacterium]
MLFNSLTFVVFLAIALALYYLPILRWKQKKIMLLLASYLFYAAWNPPLVILLWISTAVDWWVGNRLFKSETEKGRKRILMISLVVNLGFLAFFKYGGFLLENFLGLTAMLGLDWQVAAPDIILPMGISFYTFQTMSYSIDMYYRRTQPAKTMLDFALYVTFFPQLVAGPIVRANSLIPQFYEPKKVSWDQFYWGAFLLTLGMFQKVVLADVLLADVSDAIFGASGMVHPLDSWTGTLAFSGQIFFDFAGYSTCAIGVALMLGIVLPDNFRYPYAAVGFSDFWRRWHITLSTWLRDYLYIPLGGNRNGAVRTYVNLMITMLLGGLWHGAAWTFVFWGFLHGLYLGVERYLRERVQVNWTTAKMRLAAIGTYFLVLITWVFFRAPSFGKAWEMLTAMFLLDWSGAVLLQELAIIAVALVTIGLLVIHWRMRDTSVLAVSQKTPAWLLGLCWALMLVLIAIAQGTGEQFIYFQF